MPLHRPTFNRRSVLSGLGAVSILSNSPLSFAQAQTSKKKLVIVILRGAMDGLGAVPRPNDSRLRDFRPDLVANETLPLSDGFALHGSLAGLHSLYKSKEASILHAVSGPYRERSHFMAQDLLEAGLSLQVSADGWLNRALQVSPQPLSAIAIGPVTPLILRGALETGTWSPPVLPEVSLDTIDRLQDLYAADSLLGPAFTQALEVDEIAGDMMGRSKGRRNDSSALLAAGRLLSAERGPNIAVIGLNNWDMHANQAGAMTRRLTGLDAGLMTLKKELGDTWKDTAIAVVTEFGRTVRQNGTRGTDHGTGGAAFILGGAIKGGKVLGDWPGLKSIELYENRDLYPANDLRGLFKGLLKTQFGMSEQDLSATVFPGSQGIRSFA